MEYLLDMIINSEGGVLSLLILPYAFLFYILVQLKRSIDRNTETMSALVSLILRDTEVDQENYLFRKLVKKEDN